MNNQWQPIDTAPRDRTRILAFGNGTDESTWVYGAKMPPMMVVIYWSWHDGDRDEPVGDGLFRRVPCRVIEGWRPIGVHFFTPTHWMPLPDAPTYTQELIKRSIATGRGAE